MANVAWVERGFFFLVHHGDLSLSFILSVLPDDIFSRLNAAAAVAAEAAAAAAAKRILFLLL